MTGWKTVLTGALMAIIPALTDYANVIDWSFLGTTGALIASGVVMIVLRLITTTPVFKSE